MNVRFAGAKQQGLSEEQAELVGEGWEGSALPERSKRALAVADAFLAAPPRALGPAEREAAVAELGEDGLAELVLSLTLFRGLSQLLIVLGLEPEDMPTTVLATPGSS